MAQDAWWKKYQPGEPAQRPDPVIAPPNPYKQAEEQRARESSGRDEVRTGIAVRSEQRDVTQTGFKNASDLRAEFNKLPAVQEYQTIVRSYDTALNTEPNATGDQALITAYAKMLDPTSVVREGEFNVVASGDSTLGQTVARLQKEFGIGGGGMLRPEVRDRLRNEMQSMVERYNDAYNQERSRYEEIARSAGLDPDQIIGPHLGAPFFESIKESRADYYKRAGVPGRGGDRRDPEAPEGFFWAARDDSGKVLGGVYDAEGRPLGAEGGPGYDANGNPIGMYGGVTDDSQTEREKEIERRSAMMNEISGLPGALDLARQGITLGLSDEASGIGTAISGALTGDMDVIANYQLGRDVARQRLEQARERTGWGGTAVEALGGMASLGVGSLPQMTVGRAAGAGATAGAIGGYGYGEGPVDSGVNALLGGVMGGTVGAVGQGVGNAFARRAAMGQINNADNLAVAAAAKAEGVDVNRAMMDPAGYRNRIYRADASPSGGPTIQRGMERIEGQIESRAAELAQGGTPRRPQAAGDMLRAAGTRAEERTRGIKDIKYQRAEQLAGNAQIVPGQTIQVVDDMLTELGQNPNQNSAAISYLQGLREDLAAAKSTGALRDIQSGFRSQLRTRNIVLNRAQARTRQLQEAIASDIQNGLTVQGKAGAARAFQAADKAYAARMDYIEGTIQRLIGRPNDNVPAETIFKRFQNMAQGKDAAGLRRFYASLNAEERADVAATFAEGLGKNNKGEFTVTQFLRQTESLSDEALTTIFGREGAESVRNLRLVGRRVEDVTQAMNTRKSGTAAASGYRGWLTDILLGGGVAGGSIIGGADPTTAGMAGIAVAGAKGGAGYLNARLLMSPRITRWIRQAPPTTSSRAIDNHFDRLGEIAKAEPALAGDIEALRSAIMRAANDNPAVTSSAAQDQNQE